MYEKERELVLNMAKSALKYGLVTAAEGNFSVRIGNENIFAITPSAVEYDRLSLDDIVVINTNGEKIFGDRKPSSEWPLHATIYENRPEINSVAHTHSIYASIMAVIGEGIPVIIEEQVVYVKGDIRVAEYGITGTFDLAENALKALEGRRAALLKNHGLVAIAEKPEKAIYIALVAEKLAKIYYYASLKGKFSTVPDWAVELIKKHTYGEY